MSFVTNHPINTRWPAENPDILQLYSFPTPNGVKAAIMLEETGLDYEAHKVTLSDADVKSPEFTSSVLHTFKALGSDMGFKNQNFTRMQFENYSIVSKMGHHCQVVVVSRTEPSTVMEDNLLLFCKGFEKKYFNKFYENKSVIRTDEFIDAIDLVRECFDTFFIESLDLLYEPSFMDEEDVSPLSKIILKEARLQHEKDHTIVLKKLFINMYGNNIDEIQQKYKKEEILFEIFQLFKHNYFKYYNS